jgi:hypothetical protein
MNETMHANLIPAGKQYTEPGYVAAVPGLFDKPMRFTFTPLIPEERAEHLDAVDAVRTSAKKQQVYAKLVSDRLKKWDLIDGHGDAVEIRPANVLRLKPSLFSRLYGIVLGVDPSDLDPQWTAEQKGEATEIEYESALNDKPVTEVLLEGTEKNSATG